MQAVRTIDHLIDIGIRVRLVCQSPELFVKLPDLFILLVQTTSAGEDEDFARHFFFH